MFLAVITAYTSLGVFLGIYGFFYASFYPERQLRDIAAYASFAFFAILSAITIRAFIRHRPKLITKFRRPLYFYLYAFAAIPALSAFIAVTHHAALSKGVPSLYNLATTDQMLVDVQITDKRLWGKRDRHEKVLLSGFREGFPVTKRYYQSVHVGQMVTVGIRKSKLGTQVEFFQP